MKTSRITTSAITASDPLILEFSSVSSPHGPLSLEFVRKCCARKLAIMFIKSVRLALIPEEREGEGEKGVAGERKGGEGEEEGGTGEGG